MSLEQKFTALITELGVFFRDDTASGKDYQSINQLRDLALDFADEAVRSGKLSALTAFALSNQTVETEYALHPVQLLCLALYGTRGYVLDVDQRRDLLTATLFCDLGFRMAWPFHADHSTTALRALSEHRLPWWSLRIENLIANHHTPEHDPSPHKILSLGARYLELVRGTGVEHSNNDLLSPSKAIQALAEDTRFPLEARVSFCTHLGNYPVGSWVYLPTGKQGLVLANRPRSPKAPLLAVPIGDGLHGPSQFALFDTQKSNLQVFSAAPPLPLSDSVYSDPKQWMPGWDRDLVKMETGDPDFKLGEDLLKPPVATSPLATAESAAQAATVAPELAALKESPRLGDRMRERYQHAADLLKGLIIQLAGLSDDLAAISRTDTIQEDVDAFQALQRQVQEQRAVVDAMATHLDERWAMVSSSADRGAELDVESILQRILTALQKVKLYREKAATLPDLLSEKFAYTRIVQGIDYHKRGNILQAKAAFEHALTQRPTLWEANVMLQLVSLGENPSLHKAS